MNSQTADEQAEQPGFFASVLGGLLLPPDQLTAMLMLAGKLEADLVSKAE